MTKQTLTGLAKCPEIIILVYYYFTNMTYVLLLSSIQMDGLLSCHWPLLKDS